MVEDLVTENITGLMRFQFWEDAINRLYGGGTVPEHPICQELMKVSIINLDFLNKVVCKNGIISILAHFTKLQKIFITSLLETFYN